MSDTLEVTAEATCSGAGEDGGRMTAARLHPRMWRARGSAPVVSSVRLLAGPWHDYVGVWIRGGAAGTLTVTAGDGALIARLLVGEDAEEVPC